MPSPSKDCVLYDYGTKQPIGIVKLTQDEYIRGRYREVQIERFFQYEVQTRIEFYNSLSKEGQMFAHNYAEYLWLDAVYVGQVGKGNESKKLFLGFLTKDIEKAKKFCHYQFEE
jgi:hypothetical protein